MDSFTIKDLENLSGIKAHTIRMWEQRYNFLKPQRSCTNIRCYNNEELKSLLNIALLNRHGFKISQIDKMAPEEICQKILGLKDSRAVTEGIVNDLISKMVDLRTNEFEIILNRYIKTKGIERAIREIIFPFLERIGILWQTGHIMPAQEHFVSNLIRQKLIVAIDIIPFNPDGIPCLFFLPEGEHHELGLLFVSYLVKKQGGQIIYLGANVPMCDVDSVIETLNPKLAFIHFTGTTPNFSFEKFLHRYGQKNAHVQTIISGYHSRSYNKPIPRSVQLKKSLTEVMEFVTTL